MNELELKKLWQETNELNERNIFLNKKNTMEIAQLKAYNFLSSMKPSKIFTVLIGFVWVVAGLTLIFYILFNSVENVPLFFLLSAILQVGVTIIALAVYLWQLITLYNFDLSEPILKTQKSVASLKSSTLWVTRILFLQLPAWTTFWWNEHMFTEWNLFQWGFTVSITLIFTCAAIWLFVNIKYENRNKKWFQILFSGKEWKPLLQSEEMLTLINDYNKE